MAHPGALSDALTWGGQQSARCIPGRITMQPYQTVRASLAAPHTPPPHPHCMLVSELGSSAYYTGVQSPRGMVIPSEIARPADLSSCADAIFVQAMQ